VWPQCWRCALWAMPAVVWGRGCPGGGVGISSYHHHHDHRWEYKSRFRECQENPGGEGQLVLWPSHDIGVTLTLTLTQI